MRRKVERNGKVDVSMVGVESELSGEKILRAQIFIVRDSKGLYICTRMYDINYEDDLRLTFFELPVCLFIILMRRLNVLLLF